MSETELVEEDGPAGPLSKGEWAAIGGMVLFFLVLGWFVFSQATGRSFLPSWSGTSTSSTPSTQPSADTSSWAYKQGQVDGDAVARSYGFRAAPDGTVTQCDPKNESSKFVSSAADKANFDAGWIMACKAQARAAAGLPVDVQ
jgi:hypothetical protein